MSELGRIMMNDLDCFRDESKRLDSFANWPRNAGAQPAALSRAGFYYTGDRQRAACAFCQVVIDDWTFADQAIAKHRERSPNCPFVLRAYDNVRHHPTTNLTSTVSTSSPMLKESERRKTFEGWPVSFVSPEDLARAGFVYLKHDDRVQCVFCHGIVGAWEQGDVPLIEHQRHFKTCPFVLRRSDVGNISIEDEYRGHRTSSDVNPQNSSRGYDVVGRRMTMPTVATMGVSRTKGGLTNGELNILPHSPAKNPNYKNKELRLQTFADWPSHVHQDPETLAEAGFFYTGMSDHVRCFHCNGGLRNWEPKDVPWQEHARWFPNCEYISLHKGKEFIDSAKQHRPTASDSELVSEMIIENSMPNKGSETAVNQVSDAEIDEMMRSDVAKQALVDLHLEPEQIRQAMRRRISHAGYPFADTESLVNAVLDLEKVNSNGHGSQSEQAINECYVRRSASVGQMPTWTKKGMTISTNGTMLKRSVTDMEVDPRLCKICWDKDVCVVFLPCGHLVSCAECSSSLTDCPFCRQKIKGTVRTYWP